MAQQTKINKSNATQMISLYNDGLSCAKLGKIFNCDATTIDNALKRYNIKRRSNKINSKKYSCNEKFFKIIDTEEKAYWLEFIYADGYITTKKNNSARNLGISLGELD